MKTSDLTLKRFEALHVHDTIGPFLLDDITRLVGDFREARRRIAELEQANRDLERLRVEASRERDEVRKALQPFAELAGDYGETFDDDYVLLDDAFFYLTVGQLRVAQKVLAATPEP